MKKRTQLGVWPQATIRPGTSLAGPTTVVWIRLDLGAGPEWLPIGTLRAGWSPR